MPEVNTNPVLVPGSVYSQKQVKLLFGMTDATLQEWHNQGLKKFRPGTKQIFYFSDHIIELIQKFNTEEK